MKQGGIVEEFCETVPGTKGSRRYRMEYSGGGEQEIYKVLGEVAGIRYCKGERAKSFAE